MSNIIFSARISEEVRDNTQSLFSWLRAGQSRNKPFPEHLKQVIESGQFDVQARDDFSEATLLHLVVDVRPEMIPSLVRSGASVEARDHRGKTPLRYAVEFNKGGIPPLLKAGANIHVQGRDYAHLTDQIRKSRKNQVKQKMRPYLRDATEQWNAWQDGSLEPQNLTKEAVMQLLTVWPLADPQAESPRFGHLEAIFSDARWKNEHAEHKLDLIQQIPGLSPREQMFLMGGHARTAIQQSAARMREAER